MAQRPGQGARGVHTLEEAKLPPPAVGNGAEPPLPTFGIGSVNIKREHKRGTAVPLKLPLPSNKINKEFDRMR